MYPSKHNEKIATRITIVHSIKLYLISSTSIVCWIHNSHSDNFKFKNIFSKVYKEIFFSYILFQSTFWININQGTRRENVKTTKTVNSFSITFKNHSGYRDINIICNVVSKHRVVKNQTKRIIEKGLLEGKSKLLSQFLALVLLREKVFMTREFRFKIIEKISVEMLLQRIIISMNMSWYFYTLYRSLLQHMSSA